MKEIEVKVLEVDKEAVVKKILSIGGKKVFDGVVESVYFDLPEKGKVLRVRKKGGDSFITLKTGTEKGFVKSAEELEFGVEDFEKAKSLFEALGFVSGKGLFKKRESYELDGVLFEFDEYEGVPVFLEIEAGSEKEILDYCERFGFEKDKIKSWTGKDLLKFYGKNP